MTASCPHIVSSDDRTSYCDLAEHPKPISVAAADHLAAVEAERDGLRAEVADWKASALRHSGYYVEAKVRLAVLTEAAQRVVDNADLVGRSDVDDLVDALNQLDGGE